MEFVWNYYYSITRKMLLLAGQWPYQNRRERLLGTVVFLSEIFVLITQVGRFIQCDKNVQCVLKNMPTFLIHTAIIIKLLTCQFYRSKIKHLTDQLYNDWEILESPEEYEIMQTHAAKARFMSLFYCLFFCAGFPFFVLLSLTPKVLDIVWPLNESRPLLMPHECYYFVSDFKEYYYSIFFHVLISTLIGLVGLLAHDCVILAYTEHVCGTFAVAGFRFQNLADDKSIEKNNINDEVYNKKIALSVHIHWRALEFARSLENIFSLTLLVQMFLVIIGMSVTLLQVAVQPLENIAETMRYGFLVFGQLIHIFCFSLQGQRLINHSLQIQDKIYNCFWYKMPVKSQKLLLIVMKRSSQPNILSAGGIYIFSFKSFMRILQSSVSYFTVLRSLQ